MNNKKRLMALVYLCPMETEASPIFETTIGQTLLDQGHISGPVLPGAFPFSGLILLEARKLALHLVGLPPMGTDCQPHACLQLTEKYEMEGWQAVHVWEDVFRRQPELVGSRILARLGTFSRIHARQTSAQKITKAEAITFLAQHHISVPVAGRFAFGLFHRTKLVAVATFGPIRPMTREGKHVLSGELVRFCSLTGTVVTGGLGKLLGAFRAEHQPDDIMTYADRDWSNGASYRALGFTHIETTAPQAFWLSPDGIRHYPHVLQNEQGIVTTDESLLQQGYRRIYTTGNIKYIKFFA